MPTGNRRSMANRWIRPALGILVLVLAAYVLRCAMRCIAFALENGSFSLDVVPIIDKAALGAFIGLLIVWLRLSRPAA